MKTGERNGPNDLGQPIGQTLRGKAGGVAASASEVAEGEAFGPSGPATGAGKTTTMEMIEGLRLPDEGEILVGGIDGIRHRDRVKRIIGVQLQSTALFEASHRPGVPSALRQLLRHRHSPSISLLDSFDLKEKERTLVKHLSGGQRQRLAIALAVVDDPQGSLSG